MITIFTIQCRILGSGDTHRFFYVDDNLDKKYNTLAKYLPTYSPGIAREMKCKNKLLGGFITSKNSDKIHE